MKLYTEEEIESLISRFENKKLPKVEWTHEAHIVVAIWYLSHYDQKEAISLVRTNIYAHNEAVGTANSDTDGYHETITLFWMETAKRFLEQNHFDNIALACNGLISSDMGKSKYPFSFYTPELLFSVEARRNWVEPNLKKLSPASQ